jgi:hypothetical protein
MTGIWYWVWWCLFCGLLVMVSCSTVRRHQFGNHIALYVPLLAVLVFIVVFMPLAAFGVFH